jgi:hypothetical protein
MSGILGRRLGGRCGLGHPAVDVSLDVCEQVAGSANLRVDVDDDIVASIRHSQDQMGCRALWLSMREDQRVGR